MNNKAISFIKNFSYTLSSNLISMIISTLVILIVPKLIGVNEYGYWQLYIFYTNYVGFLHFGWDDGIYLRYGGEKYNELNKELFFSQFWMLFIFQLLIGTVIISVSSISHLDNNILYIIIMTAVCMLLINARRMLINILQCTNRIKKFAKITIIENLLYCCLTLIFLLVGIRQYQFLIIADIVGKFISLIYATYCCRDIVFNKLSAFYFDSKETIENISVGIKLMIANIASMLIIGIVRFGIERTWDVATFGKVSLTLSISSLMMVFIDAMGIIMFPMLRRINEQKQQMVYTTLRTVFIITILGLLVIFFPLKIFLSIWLPQYKVSILYMALLFPMCVYEGKMSLLINTYLKTLRKEKLILIINIVSVIFSIILTLVFTTFLKNLTFAIVSIVILVAFRCVLAEIVLSKILKVSYYKSILFEVGLSIIFILIGWNISSWIGGLIYLGTFGLYLLIQRKGISSSLKQLKLLVKN